MHRHFLSVVRSNKLYASLIVLFISLIAGILSIALPTYAQTPSSSSPNKVINFSARLKASNGSAVPDGLYNIGFKLYSSKDSAVPIWSETYYDENGSVAGQDFRAQVKNGHLNVKLGSRTAFSSTIAWDQGLWLTMNIGGTSQVANISSIPWDGEMSPRIELNAVPYAFSAATLNGKKAGDFVQLGQGVQTNSSDNPSIHINSTGSGNLVQLQKDAKDVFTVDKDGNISFGGDSDHLISISDANPDSDGKSLTIAGGDGGEGDTNGGNVVIKGGSGSGNGADGLVVLANAAFATTTDDVNCYPKGTLASNDCTVSQRTVDGSSAVVIGFSEENLSATLPDPQIVTPGRILYIMAANNSSPFSLLVNDRESIYMQPKSALTLLWNGLDWVTAGQVGSSSSNPKAQDIAEKPAATEGNMTIQDKSSGNELAIEGAGDAPLPPLEDVSEKQSGIKLPFQLGQFEAAPLASPGAMYYDTTIGKVQCLEEKGWGNCGDAPDTFVTISPEYKNAVMNGTDLGIISSDFCSGSLGINDGSKAQPTVCAPNETYNFYRWTTEETTDQTRSIYLTYQLPDNFKGFVEDSTSIMGRTDSDNATVDYQIYRDNGTGLISCGSLQIVSSGYKSSWQKGSATNTEDPSSCDFEAGDSILFRINLTAKTRSNAYVSNVNFIFRNS